ncbi:putative Glycosyl/glycerophosphate transferase [Pseudodesulfovibrio piezophilus C1TLV30]|uniref:Putative Glycosyl/glycerophosphate transferase n=1 Tax=Pseudodesulfovibrio piezophilus (strain DSM 21447 / JCM 15486 / C1TLV30) TaxID=1322246 RepID=M1WWS9_PSEP2|nr:putative Glycosyl/glycerophosphate transferase [Pseudodesulfovibrio piezophilus C1TLV30]
MPLVHFLIKWTRIYWFRLLKRICLSHTRSQKLWVFGARERFRYDENSKHLFEYVNRHRPDIHAVWLTRDPAIRHHLRAQGLDARMSHSIGGYTAQFMAGISFVNVSYRDVNWFLLYGCPVVQLWHGTPMMENDLKYLGEEYAFVTLASEEFLTKQHLGDPKVFDFRLTGYPRADSLARTDIAPAVKHLKQRYGFDKLVLYVPTHRRPPQWDGKGKPVVEYGLFGPYGFDFHAMEALMEKHNALFVLKLHPLQPFADAASAEHFENSSFMHLAAHDDPLADVFDFMRSTDVLITDFSSIYFDFLLLDRPVIFTPFDIKEMESTRKFRFDYNEITPGPQAHDWPETLRHLDQILNGADEFSESRQRVCRRFNHHGDNNRCSRVVNEAMQYLLTMESKSKEQS